MDIHFHGFWRMDWGLGNPNKTAALIATLMIAGWGLAYIRKWGFWIALTLFTCLGICLIHTFSRGGMVAVGTGLLPLLWLAPRPWPWKRVIAIILAAWVIVGVSIYLQAGDRYMQGIVKEDRSITHRLDIWKTTPQMMVAAPGGWGWGQASKAYQDWYQPQERGEAYLNLINSHLTWLVEIGWGGRFLYLCAWLMSFSLCWPDNGSRYFAIPLGIWITFAVASIFSHVAESPWLWILPGVSLVTILIERIRRRRWPHLTTLAGIAGLSAATLVVVYQIGATHQGIKIRANSHEVLLGDESPKIWIVLNPAIMGESYGKRIRHYLQGAKCGMSLGVVSRLDDLPDKADIIVAVAGSLGNADLVKLKQRTNLVLLNPSFFPQEVDFTKSKVVSVFFGEFSRSQALQAWQDVGIVQNVEGKGDFLANWPELVFNVSHRK